MTMQIDTLQHSLSIRFIRKVVDDIQNVRYVEVSEQYKI